jgi:hypothetical protein
MKPECTPRVRVIGPLLAKIDLPGPSDLSQIRVQPSHRRSRWEWFAKSAFPAVLGSAGYATGLHLRDLPLTAATVKQALLG